MHGMPNSEAAERPFFHLLSWLSCLLDTLWIVHLHILSHGMRSIVSNWSLARSYSVLGSCEAVCLHWLAPRPRGRSVSKVCNIHRHTLLHYDTFMIPWHTLTNLTPQPLQRMLKSGKRDVWLKEITGLCTFGCFHEGSLLTCIVFLLHSAMWTGAYLCFTGVSTPKQNYHTRVSKIVVFGVLCFQEWMNQVTEPMEEVGRSRCIPRHAHDALRLKPSQYLSKLKDQVPHPCFQVLCKLKDSASLYIVSEFLAMALCRHWSGRQEPNYQLIINSSSAWFDPQVCFPSMFQFSQGEWLKLQSIQRYSWKDVTTYSKALNPKEAADLTKVKAMEKELTGVSGVARMLNFVMFWRYFSHSEGKTLYSAYVPCTLTWGLTAFSIQRLKHWKWCSRELRQT